ncbi:hypothetical protein, partial [Klebsiella variicola]|uniref:hypothetical protein n=1 Tax=Klebsiella variicola TaxID=244366 RepID=UPI00214DAEB5
GINNLLITLKSIIKTNHLENYRGKNIGIDGHCWIHKSLYMGIHDKEFNPQSNTFLKFINQRLNLLEKYEINIFFVVDGKKPKIKS